LHDVAITKGELLCAVEKTEMKLLKLTACVLLVAMFLCPVHGAYAENNAPAGTSVSSANDNTPALSDDAPLRVFVIVGIIIFLFGLFSGHDWSLFALRTADLDNPERYSRYAKFSVTFLSALLVWVAGGYAFDAFDARRLAIAYACIVLGDIIFFFNVHSRLGVFAFAFAHFLLIRRNAFGLSTWPGQRAMWALLAVILGGSLLIMGLVFYPRLKHNRPYFSLLTGYAVIIGASVWAALVAFRTDFFPRGNAVLIAVGVVCFFLSDVCVGFYRSLPRNYAMVFATYLTWIFYAPALVLTALSCYNLDRVF
jgi:hypothetical protein